MFKRLRNRFLFMHMGVVALLVVLFFGSLLFINYGSLERDTDERVDAIWRSYNINDAVAVAGVRTYGPFAPVERRFHGGADLAGISLMMVGSAIYICTDAEQNIEFVNSPYPYMDDTFYEHITKAVFVNDAARGKLRVDDALFKYRREENALLFVDISGESNMFNGMLTSVLLIALPLLVIIFFLSLFFANRSIRPIETSFNRQKAFIADASHELKTPLAAIATNLDALSAAPEPERPKWLGYIRTEIDRMSSLTNNLLYLTKMEHAASFNALPVELSKILEGCLLPLEAVMFEKGIASETEIAPGIAVQGDAEQLHKLVAILLDNAVRYTDSHIAVKLTQIQNHALLTVENDGQGIPRGDIEKIWERFYRCDHARQFDGGYGLGLPMARRITERHRGRIHCESEEGRRTVFTVKIPLGNS